MRAAPQQQCPELQPRARCFLTKAALCCGGSELRLARQHGTRTAIPPKTCNTSSSPERRSCLCPGPRCPVVGAGSGVSSWNSSAECFHREPHARLNRRLPLPHLKLKQSTDFALRLNERPPEGTKAGQRAALSSALCFESDSGCLCLRRRMLCCQQGRSSADETQNGGGSACSQSCGDPLVHSQEEAVNPIDLA